MNHTKPTALIANVEARKAAEVVASFIAEEESRLEIEFGSGCEGLSLKDVAVDRYWDVLREMFPERFVSQAEANFEVEPKQPWVAPFNDEEASEFGSQIMSFGKHRGDTIDSIPLSYLGWLSETPDEFKEKLKRYIRARERQADEEYGDVE